jgi:hypothetical protein
MNCANHTDVSAVAYCRTCGKPLCATCKRDVRGVIYCENCLASHIGAAFPAAGATAIPGGPSAPVGENRLPSPGMAAALGFIPGVGAMYNGQFMKGFIHVMAFVCIIWMADRFGPIMIPVFFAYFFYLVFDAYKTAHAIELGQPVPDPFGLERAFGSGTHYPARSSSTVIPPVAGAVPMAGAVPVNPVDAAIEDRSCRRTPAGAFVLILLGVLFLLDNLGIFEFHWIGRMWPLILIVIGGWLFYQRWTR